MSEETDALKEQLAKAQAQMEELQALLKPVNDEYLELNAEQHVLQENFNAAMEKLRAKRKQIDEKKYEATKTVNAAISISTGLQQKLIAAEEAEKAAIAAKLAAEQAIKIAEEQKVAAEALTKRWDTLTKGAQWREWAKDHQISAAHKITESRNVILADPMGLGKTLSAIITVDMAYAASTRASEEEPWLGDIKEIYVDSHYVWTTAGIQAYIEGNMGESPAPVQRLNYSYQHATGDVDPTVSNEVGKRVNGYMNYDLKNRWIEKGWIEEVEAHYEEMIYNQITRPVGRRVLYLCPASLQKNVNEEFRMWAKHRNVIFIGGMTKAQRTYALDLIQENKVDNFVLICNYEAWRRDWNLIERFVDLNFDTLIIDEAHNAKEMRTSIYKGIDHLLTNSRPEYVIPMTGTPVLNRPSELFTLLHMVEPNEFRVLNDFNFRYCYQDDAGFWKFRPGGLEQLTKQIGKHFIRRTKAQAGIVLPGKEIIKHELEMDSQGWPKQAVARKQMRDFGTIMLQNAAKGHEMGISAAVKIAVITRLRQVETWPAGIIARDPKTKEITFQLDVEESQKVDYIINHNVNDGLWDGLIPEVIEDERVVLFSQFKAPLRELAKRINASGYKAVILDGETSEAERNLIRKDFDARFTPNRESSRWDVVLCNYKVGGVGLNFTAATQCIILDEEWNPGKRDQAYDRLHRIGQENPVTIHVIRNTPTIDDWMGNIMDTKEGIVGDFDKATSAAVDGFMDAFNNGLI